MSCNIITPPDLMSARSNNVLLIDPTEAELEIIALYCGSLDSDVNIYAYLEKMDDVGWLCDVIEKRIPIVVNTLNNSISHIKDKLAVNPAVQYYGPKRFLMNNNRIEHPLEYFTNEQ